jgi:glycosyltransferase involved in cell wall biosynthesis
MPTAVVIPVYNEAATIRGLVERVLKHTAMVIVVDDGSTDGSRQRLTGLSVTLLQNVQNRGKGYSLQRGLQHAFSLGARQAITLDGDGQHDPDEIPRILQAAMSHPHSIIIAARLKQRQNAPKVRLLANKIADFWISRAAGYAIVDSQSGFRLYPQKLQQALSSQTNRARGFVFESEILIEAASQGIHSVSIPVESIYPEGGRLSHYQPWSDTWQIVRMIAGRLKGKRSYLK